MANTAYGLVPIESIILGNFSKKDKVEISDPLDYIFQMEHIEDQEKIADHREYLALYRGFYEEGAALDNRCKDRPEAIYASSNDKERVTRSMMATLQYIGLDIAVRAIPKYAKYFEFTNEEYMNLVDGLVGNWCSQNLTIISLKTLKDNFKVKFENENTFQLPTLGKNPLFPEYLSKFISEDKAREREFHQTLDLFKSFCSWGGDISNAKLMVPLLRNPQIMSFVVRQMAGLKLSWSKRDQGFHYTDEPNSTRVLCRNLICRRESALRFKENIPKVVGSRGLQDDFQRNYCESLRDLDFDMKEQDKKILDRIKSMTFDEQNLQVSQMIALLTGVPDFLVRSEKFSDGKNFMRASVDQIWDEWAKKQSAKFGKDLLFEESLTLELVDRSLFFNSFEKEFKVIFDVNLGEFDRVNQVLGKITTKFDIKVSRGFLNWARRQMLSSEDNFLELREKAKERFKLIVADYVEEARFKFSIPPWKGDLEELIVREVLSQLSTFKGDLFEMDDRGIATIPVVFNYGPFALRYIHYLHKVNENQEDIKKGLETFQNEQRAAALKIEGRESVEIVR